MMKRHPDLMIIDVLPPNAYQDYHLPQAINVPWGGDFGQQRRFEQKIGRVLPKKKAPVIVYCMDLKCGASPAAARRLGELGFERVFDYAAGKADWKDAGLPIER
jgi:rhodanese-related sulfurtransferase